MTAKLEPRRRKIIGVCPCGQATAKNRARCQACFEKHKNELRECRRCHLVKATEEFYANRQKKDGIDPWCKSCKNAYSVKYNREHPEQKKRYAATCWARTQASPESFAKWLGYRQARLEKFREAVRAYYGKSCICCGEANPVFLTIDHINGGGNKQRREVKRSGVHFYKWLVDHGLPDGYQTLCFNCNWAKHHLGKCPHEDVNAIHLVGACG